MINQAQLLAASSASRCFSSRVGPRRRGPPSHRFARRSAIMARGCGSFALIAQAAGQIDAAVEALRRIITIEREPPEIVGALADMLGTAGRHEEALAQWTRLAVLLPANPDAHLNRAISAGSAGKQDIAIAAADAGLARFPGPCATARRSRRWRFATPDGSRNCCPCSMPPSPPIRTAPLTRHNQAVALRVACRFDEACAAFAAKRATRHERVRSSTPTGRPPRSKREMSIGRRRSIRSRA